VTDIIPLKMACGTAYVLAAEVAAVFPTESGRFDRCLVYVDNQPGPYEVLMPPQEMAKLWAEYLTEDDTSEDSAE